MEKRVYDGEIKLENSVKKIKINENGDYLTLPINDTTFPRRYAQILKEMQEIADNKEILDSSDTDKKLKIIESKQIKLAEKVNEFFGENICKKVFGTNSPYIDDLTEFLMQISELIEKFTGEKLSNLNKIGEKYLDKQKARAGNSGG